MSSPNELIDDTTVDSRLREIPGWERRGNALHRDFEFADFTAAFDFKEVLERVTIDISRSHIWDISSVAALDMIVLKFRREGAEVKIVGMNKATETIVDKLAIHDEPGALERLMGH